MQKYLIIYEDDKTANFNPMTLLRPVYFLRPGIRYLYERLVDSFSGYSPILFCRPEIADLTAEKCNIPVNSFEANNSDEIIFINGRIKHDENFVSALIQAGENVILSSENTIVAFKAIGKIPDNEMTDLKDGNLSGFVDSFQKRAQSMEVELPLYNYLWDLVNDIHDAIKIDFEYFKSQEDASGFLISRENMRQQGREYTGVDFLNYENIYISRDADILPGVVLDASHGPIFIGSRVKIEPNTYVIGPVYVGKESQLVGGKIDACSIGPVCRAGGEVEEAIIQGYTNKYHAGFLGNAYVGEWINFGAMTTNSDLKNNYATVSVMVNGKLIDTGSLKVGSFIGDFTKTAIGTLLNTGINIGISCNIVPEGLVIDKEIPSFTWYSFKKKMAYSLNKAVTTIERTMSRRGMKLSEPLRKRLGEISQDRPE